MRWFIQIFTMPSAVECAQAELEDAKRQLLAALSASEYATKIAQYHQVRVTRLERCLEEETI